ncbi:MAG: hypothetical protein ACM3SQ_03485 [Betaproteobacteria bacterium]
MNTWWTKNATIGMRIAATFAAAACILLTAPAFEAQSLDICGCASVPNLQPFDTSNPATYPPGTSDSGFNGTLTLPLPPDGVFRFSSFAVQNRNVTFVSNAANTPVTILVAGDVSLSGTNCCFSFTVSGSSGSSGTSSLAGVGGLGGPGGFRGGDGASQGINGAAIGGTGFGPGGGGGGTAAPFTNAVGGTFLGLPELIPLAGGSGGGGGSSNGTSTSCSGGGGGGGGGALLIAANGTLTITNYQLFSDGGSGAGGGNGSCGSVGGGGSGGAIRLVANRLVQAAIANIFARAGGNGGAADGRIRLESIDTSAQTQFGATPPALRIVGPTPLANPINPTVTITSVGGSAVPAVPQGTFGAIDVVLPAPGATPVLVATTGVPSGTTVAISVKPRIGGPAISQTVPLTSCDTAGACSATATFDLAAGAYVVEAQATFQVQ